MSKKVIIIGGQGNATVLGDTIIDANRLGFSEYEFVGYINDVDKVSEIEGMPILGGLHDVQKFIQQGYYIIFCIYKFEDQKNRIKLFNDLMIPESNLVKFVHPLAFVAHSVKIGPGTFICANVSVTSSTEFGLNCIVRPGSTIGHNNVFGNHVSISAGASVGSCIQLGDGAFVGLKASIREYIQIAPYSMIGMGAVQTKNTGEAELWVGNPSTFVRKAKWFENKS
jgi:sugar O-acyltransferase (sialic acid O-acetyltransferase NeuD family)